MSKLVDKERLARLAAALDARAKAAVKAEADRAKEVEESLQSAIDAINHAENGILAQAKAHAETKDAAQKEALEGQINAVQGAVNTEKGRAEGVEAGLQQAINAINNAETGILKQAKDYTDGKEVQIRADIKAVTDDHETRLQTAEGDIDKAEADIKGLQADIAAIKGGDVEVDLKDVDDRIKALEAKHDGDNSVEKQIEAAQNAADKAQEEVDALELVVGVEAAEGQEASGIFKKMDEAHAAIERQMAADKAELEGKVTTEAGARETADNAINAEIAKMKNVNEEGSLAKQIADEVSRADAEEKRIAGLVDANTQAIAVINGEGEGSIKKAVADLVNGAPETLDTLDELAAALRDNKDVLSAVETAFDNKLDAQKQALQKEIDDEVKVVADALADEKDATKAGSLAKQIADEAKARDDADKALDGRVAANEAFVAAQPAIDQEQDRRLGVLEGLISGGEGDENALTQLQNAIDAAQEAAEAAQADVDAVEKRLDDEGGLVDRLEAAEAFVAAQPGIDEAQQDAIDDLVERMVAMEGFEEEHSHSAMEQGIANNAAAIEAEVKQGGARDAAIAAALEAYSTTEEMKTILGNVVATLNLSMVDDKVVLKLGGAEGIALSEVSLDLATDADIDAIIAGLDAE